MKTSRIIGACLVAGLLGACSGGTASEEVGRSESAVIGVDTHLYFRSNASGWGADESTRLATNLGGAFFKRINVTESWMVSGVDTAVVTETNELNGWGSSQTFYTLVGPKTLLVPITLAIARPFPADSDPHFKVDYATLGYHQVSVNTAHTPFLIGIRSEADVCSEVSCPSRSHCALGSNGLPTCVGDQPVCGSAQCAPFSICCNASCANAFCFGGSGSCPPVACQ
ncbi:MAG: hypothetical protein QM756_33435 [Polyangiaceae bacterium]